MRKCGKWVLTLGLVAATPGLPGFSGWELLAQERGVPAPKSTNQSTADAIAQALSQAKQSGELVGFDMDIEYKNGVAVLKGSVNDLKHKDVATRVVERVQGVKSVDNRLTYSPKASQKRQAPSKGVVNAAIADAQKYPRGIQPASHEVPVAAPAQYQTPQPLAAAPVAGASNQQVAEQIAGALSGAQLDGYDIEIRYLDGVAVLEGSVPTAAQRAAAERLASGVSGVQSVRNRLRLTQEQERPQGPMAHPASMGGAPYPGMHPAAMQQAAYGPQGMGPQGMPPQGPYGQPGYGPQQSMAPQGPYQNASYAQGPGGPAPASIGPAGYNGSGTPAAYNMPNMPDYAWPSYAQYPNSAAVNYPQQYSASAWPYIGPFYPYPQVPLGWRKASLEWDDGNWNLKFNSKTDRWWWFLSPKNWE